MYRFVSSKNTAELKKRYLKLYNVNLLQKKLDTLMRSYPDIKIILPADLNAMKLLISDFKYLTKVYCAFIDHLNTKSPVDRRSIRTAFVNGGFNYDSHTKKIADFLTDSNNGFEIHNCVYCDLVDVTAFPKRNGELVRRFQTEHVLDKGECPLVALSLYNFVPTCVTCNSTAIKGTKTIGDTEAEIVKLSPTTKGYDFDGNVKFEVKLVTPGASPFDASKHPEDFEINFIVKEKIYQKSIDLFELKPRYNHGIEKMELLDWRDFRHNNPNNIVQEMANLKRVSFEEVFEEMFELNKRRNEHYPMEKARRDVMLL